MNTLFETKVLGGLPVTISFDGDEWFIYEVNGKLCKKPPQFIYRKLSEEDNQRILRESQEAQSNQLGE